ncbi:protein kinase C-like 1B [Ranitomeya variabilis]|uniref:protein kinase C-like 1B n=1 Tax=Ranitomeya variabilis TaxID=490064 RepID=UPI0040572BDE
MSFRAGKKWKKISNREETTTSNNKDGLLYQDVDVLHDTREDTNGERNTPNEASSQHDVNTSHTLRRGRDKSWTRDSRTRDEPPYKKRRGLDAEEDQDINSPQKTQVDPRVLKRKREEEQVKGDGGEGTSQCSMMVAKRPKPDTNSCPVAGEGSIQSDDIPPTIPDTLSEESFTYHKVLGQGHFGKVLLASENVSGHRLAIKILKKRRLLKERRMTAAINEKIVLQIAERSPFLCASFATFQTSDYLFYVMDYMVGGDLHQLIKSKAPFDIETTRLYTAELTCGLQFLHSRGIKHRDLKPLNIFIDGDSHTKIGDFGLSNIDVYEDEKVSGYAGTPKYMAPEVRNTSSYHIVITVLSIVNTRLSG